MKNIVYQFMFVLLISGVLFTGCGGEEVEEVVDTEEEVVEEELPIDEGLEEEDGEDESADEEVEELEESNDGSNPPGLSISLPEGGEETAADEEVEPATEAVTDEAEESTADTTTYVDGSYTQSGSYQAPSGTESMGVTLVLEGDVVKSVSISPNSSHDVSLKYQQGFATDVQGLVVGKSLDEIGNLSAVNGSSLTPKGFNAAVSAIKAAAKA